MLSLSICSGFWLVITYNSKQYFGGQDTIFHYLNGHSRPVVGGRISNCFLRKVFKETRSVGLLCRLMSDVKLICRPDFLIF